MQPSPLNHIFRLRFYALSKHTPRNFPVLVNRMHELNRNPAVLHSEIDLALCNKGPHGVRICQAPNVMRRVVIF